MKTFSQLTPDQKDAAYKYARRALQEALTQGFLVVDEEGTQLSCSGVERLAQDAAEGGRYDDDGKPFLEEGFEVPFIFQGGCV